MNSELWTLIQLHSARIDHVNVKCKCDLCLVYTVQAKWRVELRAKIGQYRNRCFDLHETDKRTDVTTMICLLLHLSNNHVTRRRLYHFNCNIM